jgi:hypothetical protein
MWTQPTGTTKPTVRVDADNVPLGILLADIRGHRLTISAPAGQTLDGTGTMRCVLWNDKLQQWVDAPDFDVPVTSPSVTSYTGRSRTFADVYQMVPVASELYYWRDSVGVSGGGDLTVLVEVEAWRP